MEDILEIICNKIKEVENNLLKFSQKILQTSPAIKLKVDGNLENFLVAGIDSGFIKKSFHSIDMFLIKARASILSFENNKLKNIFYYPENPKTNLIYYFDKASDLEFDRAVNFERIKLEFSLALELLEKFNLDFLFLDGPLFPRYVKKVNLEELKDLIKKLENFKNKTIIAGIVEDTRAKLFCKYLEKNFLDKFSREDFIYLSNFNDSLLLTNLLDLNERTIIFKVKENIRSFYFRNSMEERVLRVEFFDCEDNEKVANKISLALSKTKFSEIYNFPLPLIEADLKSRISEIEFENIYKIIEAKLGKSSLILKLRRELRPF